MKRLSLATALALLCSPALASPPPSPPPVGEVAAKQPEGPPGAEGRIATLTAQIRKLSVLVAVLQQQRNAATDQLTLDAVGAEIAKEDAEAKAAKAAPAHRRARPAPEDPSVAFGDTSPTGGGERPTP